MNIKDYIFPRITLHKSNFQKSFFLFIFLAVLNLGGLCAQSVSITSSQPNASEAGPPNGQYVISVINGGAGQFYTVDLAIDPASTADINDDYDPFVTTVGIATNFFGNGNAFVNLNVVDDNLVEVSENVILNIVNISPALPVGSGTATVNIADNDTGVITVASLVPQGNEEGATFARFRLTSSNPNATGATVNVAFNLSGTAVNNTDYNQTGVFTFPSNATTVIRSITITPIDDTLVEGLETVTLTLTGTNNALFTIGGADEATVSILDNDYTARITATDNNAAENTPSNQIGTFTVDLGDTNNTGSAITVNFTRAGTATNATDYNDLGLSVTIPDGSQTGTITVTPNDDNVAEGAETVILNLAPGTGYELGNPASQTATVNINDNDTAGVNVLAISGNTTEAGGTATFTVTLGSQPTNNVSIALSSNDTSEGAVATSVVKTPGNWNTNTIVTVTGVDDAIVDGDIAYSIITGNVTSADTNYNALNGNAVANVAVTNTDDDVASLSISDIAVNEDVASGNLVFEVVLDLGVSGGTTVGYSFSNGTAIGGGTDFTANPGTLSFDGTAGEIETITVAINNDQVLEQSEDFTVQLGLPTNGVNLNGSGSATGTINDDDNCAPAPILDTSVPTVFCDVIDRSLTEYTNTTAPSGTVLTWSTLSNPLNENAYLTPAQVTNPPNDGSYFGFFLDNNGTPANFDDDCSSGVIEVELTLNTSPDAPVGTGNERCGPGTVLLTANTSAGASLNWYNSIDSDTPLGTGANFTTPSINATTSFYVEAVENNCATERQEVVAVVGIQISAGTPTNASICSVPENGPTILDLDDRLAGEGTGTWAITTDPSGGLTIGSSNIIDFRDLVAGNYVFTFTTTGSTAPCVDVSSEVTIAVSDCDTDEDGDGLFGGDEASLGTDPSNADTDGDGINDGVEAGPDVDNPLDEDADGIIDALDSNILDTDNDGVNDQQDLGNTNPCIPSRANGLCDFDGDTIPDEDEIANGSDPDNPCDPNEDSPACIPIDLAITKTVDIQDAAIGDTVVFTITLTNPENRAATNIVVGDLLETGFEFVSSNPSIGTYSEVTGEWNNFEIAPMSSETLDITVTIVEGSDYSNTAELLSSLPIDDNTANNMATVQVNIDLPEGIDLVILKTVDNRAPLVGEQITFTISVENQSQDDAIINNIEVEDILSTGPDARFVYQSHVANSGDYDSLTGIWTIESLAVGEQNIATLDITVTVPREGIFVNTATLIRSSPIDSNPNNNEDFVDVTVSVPTPADPGFLFNQFSPNGDGTNDVLRINLRDAETGLDEGIVYNIAVFDRYGNLVFEGNDSILGNTQRNAEIWDGSYKGKDVPKGTYYYILNYDIGGGATIDKGWIQLIR